MNDKFVWDDAAAQAMFKRLEDAGQDTAPLLSTLAYSLAQRAKLTFLDQQDPWGHAWTPLAAATKAARRKGKETSRDHKILLDTGLLIQTLVGGEVLGGEAEINIGFKDRPATIHQFGGKAGRGRKVTIPARPMLPIKTGGVVDMPPTWAEELVDALTAHVEAALG